MRSRTPKVLHMVCGRHMIDWVIAAVAEAGADSITVVINPHHAELAAHLSEKDPTIEVVYQREPKGTAHALQQVENLKGDVLVVNGDSPLLTSSTVMRVVAAHRGAKRPATLASVAGRFAPRWAATTRMTVLDVRRGESPLTTSTSPLRFSTCCSAWAVPFGSRW